MPISFRSLSPQSYIFFFFLLDLQEDSYFYFILIGPFSKFEVHIYNGIWTRRKKKLKSRNLWCKRCYTIWEPFFPLCTAFMLGECQFERSAFFFGDFDYKNRKYVTFWWKGSFLLNSSSMFICVHAFMFNHFAVVLCSLFTLLHNTFALFSI